MSINRPEQHTHVTPDALPQHIQRVDEAFDNTSLPQAHAEGLLDKQVPDHAQDVIDRAAPDAANFIERHEVPASPAKRRRGLIIGASATVAAGLIAAGAVFGVKAATDQPTNNSPQPGPDTASSAPTLPGPAETLKAPEKELATADFEIPAGLTAEQFAEAFVGKGGTRNKWEKSLANDAVQEDWLKNGGSDAYMAKLSAPIAKAAAEGMFGPGWEQNPTLAKIVTGFQRSSEVEALYYIHTSAIADNSKEQWESHYAVVSGKELDRWPEGRRIGITFKTVNNAEMNVIGSEAPEYLAQNGQEVIWTVQTKFAKDKEYIVGWMGASRYVSD